MYEIERRFLINDLSAAMQDIVDHHVKTEEIVQGYLSTDQEKTIRVRMTRNKSTGANPAFLTVKGKTTGIRKIEIETEIGVAQALQLYINFRSGSIKKTRHTIMLNDMIWELDEFDAPMTGLWIAEIELKDEDQPIVIPAWAGEEISHDRRYSNANMSKKPWPFK